MKLTLEFSSMQEMADFLRARGVDATGIGKTTIRAAALTVRAENCLLAAGFEYIEDAQQRGEWELLRLPNVGRQTAQEVMKWKAKA
jgi:DNA-directed RNA polymerase alpha subunit